MEKQKKFQNRKLNKDDHKGVERAVGGLKKGLAVAAIVTPIVFVVKKNGIKGINQVASVASKMIFKL